MLHHIEITDEKTVVLRGLFVFAYAVYLLHWLDSSLLAIDKVHVLVNNSFMSELVQFRDPELAIPKNGEQPEVVGFYPREFFMLDNFASFQIEYGDVVWPTAEHLYQASHFFETHPGLAEQILQAPSAHEAYKIARANKHHAPDYWDDIKLELMEEIVKMKLEQHPYIQKKLLETGDIEIVEDSTKDSFWGWGPDGKGHNELGKIWMRLRDELKAEVVLSVEEG